MIFKPPQITIKNYIGKPSVFLAGSIEMGIAEDWQTELAKWFSSSLIDWDVYNPRRDDWDVSWTQTFENPQFNQQVNWELDQLSRADLIVMYFAPGTKSPISLLELGLYADSGKIIVICPEGFWRKGNVDIICSRYGIPLFNNISDFKEAYFLKLSS